MEEFPQGIDLKLLQKSNPRLKILNKLRYVSQGAYGKIYTDGKFVYKIALALPWIVEDVLGFRSIYLCKYYRAWVLQSPKRIPYKFLRDNCYSSIYGKVPNRVEARYAELYLIKMEKLKPLTRKKDIFTEVYPGVDYLLRKGYYYLDWHRGNVRLDPKTGKAKLIDLL